MIKYKKNDIITGEVTGIENYGIFVKIDKEYSGLIHISEISDSFVKNVGDYAKIGNEITAEVIETDEESHQLKLSIKKFNSGNNKKKKSKIVETPSGFSGLKRNLNRWISEKLEEINNKNKNI